MRVSITLVKDVIIIALLVVVVMMIITRPEVPDQVVDEHLDQVEDIQSELDSMTRLWDEIRKKMKDDSLQNARVLQRKDLRISALQKKLNEVDIKDLPVPELDSIVIALYGPGALPPD